MWHQRADTQLVEPGDTGFWRNLWRTDVFRALIEDPSTGYAALLARASRMPWWFVSAEHAYERRHFSVWFGQAIVRRRYDNPAIEDLYYFHDMLHALTFADASRMDQDRWRLAMRANEIAVSTETEMLIYWRHPELRPVSFCSPIWQDQVVEGLSPFAIARLIEYRTKLLAEANGPWAAHEKNLLSALPAWPLEHPSLPNQDLPSRGVLWDLRRAVSLSPDPANAVEMELARYENQAEPFYEAWSNRWRDVEQERTIFANLCAAGKWKEAVARRHGIWEQVSNADGVPFGDLAQSLA